MATSLSQQQAYYQASAQPLLPKKKPPPTVATPKPVGSADPYGANAIVNQINSLEPDYSAVKPIDYASIKADALTQADQQIAAEQQPYRDAQAQNTANMKLSTSAATNFTAALAGILTGGLPGQAGRDYALKTFGGSFLGEIKTDEGIKMVLDITHDFRAQDAQFADKISEIAAKKPDIAYNLYQDVVKQEEENQANGIKLADSTYEHRVKALTLMLTQARINEKNAAAAGKTNTKLVGGSLYERDPRTGKWNLVVQGQGKTKVQWNQKTGDVYTFDDQGRIIGHQKVAPNPAGAAKPVNGVKAPQPDGSVWLVNPRTGAKIARISGAGSVSTPSTPGASATVQKDTPVAVRNIGERALNKILDSIWAKRTGNPPKEIAGPDGKMIANPAYQRAQDNYNAWLANGKSFNTAMARVTAAIKGPLTKSGFSRDQIREAAYRIVAAEMDPPAGYKMPGKAEAGTTPASAHAQSIVSGALQVAASQIGKPYVFGSGPDSTSFDCSDLIQYAYGQMGVKLPRTTFDQIKAGTGVTYRTIQDLQPGDLIFPSSHHVVLYVGNGKVIAAPHTGELVQVQNLSDFGKPVAVRRIVQGGVTF